MHNIEFYVPEIKDYWYEKKLENDKDTMSYNIGYDVSYSGYDYDTGCISFNEDRWESTYQKRKSKDIFFAYIKDLDLDKFVGYVNYYYLQTEKRYMCGVVIEYKYRRCKYGYDALKLLCERAKENGIKALYDDFELDRVSALNLFLSLGFEVVEHKKWKKLGKELEGVIVRKILN